MDKVIAIISYSVVALGMAILLAIPVFHAFHVVWP